MHLLQAHLRREAQKDESHRILVRERLRCALEEYLAGIPVWLYGSVTEPGGFHRASSDVDIAIERLPQNGPSLYQLQSLLSAALGVPVDICVLNETRLEPSIREKGEQWIASPSKS